MPSAVIGAAITGGASLAGGLLNKKKSATTTPQYSAEQTNLQSALSGKLTDRLNNPANLDPLKTAAASGVNRSFDGVQSQLERRLAGRGFGSSGKLVTNSKNIQIGRAGALGNLESQFAAMQLDQEKDSIDQAQRFAFAGAGQKQEQSGGGGFLGGAVGAGAETASMLYALNHFMGGGGDAVTSSGIQSSGPPKPTG